MWLAEPGLSCTPARGRSMALWQSFKPMGKRFQRFQYFLEPGEISVFLSPACWFISSRSRCEEDAVFCSLIILTPALTSI